jgi:DNA recombination protein RmuC
VDSSLLIFVVVLAALLVGAMLGFLIAQIRAARRIASVRIELESARVRLESTARQEADRIALLEQSEMRLRAAFESLASDTLRSNSELFLQLARESLGRDQAIAASTLKERETAISQLIEPIREALQKTEAQVAALERERRDAFSSLRTQIETLANGQMQLQRETRNLVTALRRPEVRGRWGELTLRRLVELAGMAEHCDFTEQLSIPGLEGTLRPDLVVHMPESRDLVVDVKAPLDAYLEALEAATDESRQLALKRHGQQVETRVRQLSSKSYWTQFEHSPEFVVLFLPGDQFLSAALAERPELLENALKQNVILATPSTLIALLKTVAYGWRQAAVAENAATIRELGQELYRRLGNFTTHLGRVGQRLGSAVEAYNAAVGSLERQVMPQARRFPELGVTPDAPLPELEQIDHLARALTTPATQVTMDLSSGSRVRADGEPNA